MKKTVKFLIPIACLLMAVASFGVTYAYLTASDSKVNEFKVGENDIQIEETFEAPEKLTPDTNIKKEPRVYNTGELPCYVRMRADFSDSNAEKFCTVNYNEDKWTEKQADGYYYYKEILMPGKKTEPLFTTVHINEYVDGKKIEEKDMIDFDIIIYAESRHAESLQNDADSTEADYYITVWEGK